jgi:hypothetical protein
MNLVGLLVVGGELSKGRVWMLVGCSYIILLRRQQKSRSSMILPLQQQQQKSILKLQD